VASGQTGVRGEEKKKLKGGRSTEEGVREGKEEGFEIGALLTRNTEVQRKVQLPMMNGKRRVPGELFTKRFSLKGRRKKRDSQCKDRPGKSKETGG